MKEYKVGEQILLEVQENKSCENCFFSKFIREDIACTPCPVRKGCKAYGRSDRKSVIFVEKKGK